MRDHKILYYYVVVVVFYCRFFLFFFFFIIFYLLRLFACLFVGCFLSFLFVCGIFVWCFGGFLVCFVCRFVFPSICVLADFFSF